VAPGTVNSCGDDKSRPEPANAQTVTSETGVTIGRYPLPGDRGDCVVLSLELSWYNGAATTDIFIKWVPDM
jgi:hypothetical protein